MEIFENLIIIGTSHIAIESVKEVEEIIRKKKPDCVALELDKGRFLTLLTKNRKKLTWRDIRHIGVKGYLFAKFGEYAEVKLGSMVGVSPGDEMIRAAQVAAERAGTVALEFGMKNLDVNVKGPGPGRESAVRSLNNLGVHIISINYVTPIPHNGSRPCKKRRV